MSEPLLKVENLKKYYPIKSGGFGKVSETVRAVDGVSFSIREGETLGIVGESGCGKSTTGRMIMRLIEPTEGKIMFQGKNIMNLSKRDMRKARKDIQMIFQDPFASLNPRHTVGRIIEEPMIVHKMGNRKQRQKRVEELLELVGLSAYHARRYPHQFSGGQRQRIGIARALAVQPKVIIADEPVSALDVSVQSQVLNLLKDLQKKFNLTFIFIAHDLSVVRHISDSVGVMYLGKIVELSESENLYNHPNHPYTKALLSAVPVPDPEIKTKRIILEGDVPSPAHPPSGCAFHDRCPVAMDICSKERPHLKTLEDGRMVSCHLFD
ncbi:ABC transporter ATP-binding protein [Sporolactobacillus laevolacticus]|uniref:Peptide ABC transporter substrate-binding protein n=1 Tax=Sporolactobacillus laevolacticus DSM 442 TaxID=1395513 RepID=V6ITS0_9BACL|nr:dipeptide ABC transporter ATP-binding protein [Sporolactobacillus laevolacticus]EST10268.1 peptide ABC transporter substrate-binding protein [Sporolactobacillus laevolacticus DSM 442]